MTNALLEVKNLTIRFAQKNTDFYAVNDLSFQLRRGETFALLGESGCGKSLTALAIMRLLPDAARVDNNSQIFLSGENLLHYPEQHMRCIRGRHIGMIFQEPMSALNPVLTIGQQLAEVLFTHFSLSAQKRHQRCLELLDAVGIPAAKQRIHHYPHQLSGGMRQRVMIAMAIAAKPDILIADEPTTALDVTIQAQILDLLQALQKSHDMAILLITHDFAVAAQVADNIGVMYAGEFVEQAPSETFFQAPTHAYSKKLFAALPRMPSQASIAAEVQPATVSNVSNLNIQHLAIHFPLYKGWLKRQVGAVKAVDGVSLQLSSGKTLALVGESGCGKSTLAKGVMQLLPSTSGEIRFNDQVLANLRAGQLKQYRRDVQLIFQDPFSAMNPRMMVADIIAEGMRALGIIKDPKTCQQRIDELLTQVGLSPEMKYRYPHEFSGGQRQRICIARALAVQPKVLICDEPTSALDVSVQAQILNLLQALQQGLGLAYLFISHDIAVVGQVADEIAVMYLGRIVEYGPTRQVLTQPKHPYTQALLSAVPKLDSRKQPRIQLSGELSSPLHPPSGCHFHPRCQHAMPICKQHYPHTTHLPAKQSVNCFLYATDKADKISCVVESTKSAQ
jgi:peptide/nickel transport system ATP-binding protein